MGSLCRVVSREIGLIGHRLQQETLCSAEGRLAWGRWWVREEAGTPLGKSYHNNLSKTLWLLRFKVITMEMIGHAKTCHFQDFIFYPFKVFFTLAQNYFIDWRFQSLALIWSCGLPNLWTRPWIVALSLKTQPFKSQNLEGTTFFSALQRTCPFPASVSPRWPHCNLTDERKQGQNKAGKARGKPSITVSGISSLHSCFATSQIEKIFASHVGVREHTLWNNVTFMEPLVPGDLQLPTG